MAADTLQQTFESAAQQHQAGKLSEAEVLYRRVLDEEPAHAGALHLLGVLSFQAGRHDAALDLIDRAIAAKPRNADYYANRAVILAAVGRWEESIQACRQAIGLQPNHAPALNVLGSALRAIGQFDEAIEAYRRAIAAAPDAADPHNNLCAVLAQRGKFQEAVLFGRRALELLPQYPEAYNNLGNALREMGYIDEAITCYGQALALNPKFADAYNNVGVALKARGQLEEAAACHKQSLALQPNHALAYNNLGSVLMELGQLDDALQCFDRATKLLPGYAGAHSNRAYALQFHSRFDVAAIFSELRQWNLRHAQPLRKFIRAHDNEASPDRRIRVGYVSSNFRDHAQSLFASPLLSNHDKKKMEIFCYSGVAMPDAVTERLRGYADIWRGTIGLMDHEVAELIRQDKIDVLVDLTMHAVDNRLLVFAYKPAPIQVAWLAYPGGTGLDAMDYRLTDPHLDPPGLFDGYYVEQSVRLADTFWCYDPSASAPGDQPTVGPLPALQNGFVTFGCLADFCKMGEQTLELWTAAMNAVEKSKLIVSAPGGQVRQQLAAKFQQAGISADRIEFVDRQPRKRYMELYHRIDIGLETLPCNGHATSLDALWMGVPVVTMAGPTVAGRAGWSHLSNLALTELAARTPKHYARVVARLAGDMPALAELRAGLRDRMLRSPLTDGALFARNVEAAYRTMWRRWCDAHRK